jgi:putative ABC transport system permease protein
MLINYLKITLRNMGRHRLFSLINLVGLVLGILAYLLIMTWVGYEMSFDGFNEHKDRIQRLCVDLEAGSHMIYPMTMPAAAQLLINDYPEVINAARLEGPTRASIKIGEQTFIEPGVAHGDNSLFEVFSFPFISGDIKNALVEPYTVVLTQSTAQKYFADKDPMGEVIQINGKGDYTVTGIVKDIPQNSHFRFNIMASFASLYAADPDLMGNWFHIQFFTYLLFAENADVKAFADRLPEFVDTYMGSRLSGAGATLKLFMQPLTRIHLHSDLAGDIAVQADVKTLYLFLGIAIFVLLLACINFINLSTASVAVRAREIGLRKVFGSSRKELIWQFLLESFIFSFIATLIAVAAVEIIRPYFQELFGTYVDINFLNPLTIIMLLLAFPVIVTLLAGSYPTLYLSALQPVSILKKGFFRSANRSYLRSILVIFQFSISIILIISTLTISKQINYMKHSDPGFKEENVIVLPGIRSLINEVSVDILRQTLTQLPEVEQIGFSSLLPGRGTQKALMYPEGFPDDQPQMGEKLFVDADYIDAIGIEILKGRNFSPDLLSDPQSSVIINETAAANFGWEEPIGKIFSFTSRSGGKSQMQVIGLVRDFHSTSLRESIEPLIIYNNESRLNFLTLRLRTDDLKGTIAKLKQQIKKLKPDFGFRYYFLEEILDNMYREDLQTAKLALYFSIMAILLGCLGLLGLTTFLVSNRTKEIGIRKVMGASGQSIIILLARQFCKWVLIAIVISLPIAGYLMNIWLRNFAYRTQTGFFIYAAAAIFALLISIVTISFQTIKTARANPVEALKYE